MFAMGNTVSSTDPQRANADAAAQNHPPRIHALNRKSFRPPRRRGGRPRLRAKDRHSFFALRKPGSSQAPGRARPGDIQDPLAQAEAALFQIESLLEELRARAIRSGNDTLTSEQRSDLHRGRPRRSNCLIDFAVQAPEGPIDEPDGPQNRLTDLEDILATHTAAEESVASRFGDADRAREQVEQVKLQLFNQLATAQIPEARAGRPSLVGAFAEGSRE